MPGGFSGVDIFFVISGFLISTILFDALNDNTFSFIDFYSRRIRRIFPTLLAVLIACIGFGWFALLADEYQQLGKHAVGGAGFVSNLLFWREVGYFDNAADTKPLLHLWSLGIEEQFYILYPPLLLLIWRFKNQVPLVIGAILALSFTFNIYLVNHNPGATFYSPPTRWWELLSGSLLAWLTLYQSSRFTKNLTIKNILSILGGLLIIGGAFLISPP